MQATLFDTPVLKQVMKGLSWLFLKITRFSIVGLPPKGRGYVMIAAPHTSNWDFPYLLAMAYTLDIKIHWMGKSSLFKGVWGPIMRYLGGISIDRSKNTNMVQQVVEYYETHPGTIVVIPPEGTRSKAERWKSGFYHIAVGAKVDIVLAYLCFAKREGGILNVYTPSGEIEKDMPEIQAYYEGVTGAKPENF